MTNQFFTSIAGTFATLFPITNPLGVVPIFYGLAGSAPSHVRGRQARQAAFNAVLVLMIFFIVGRLILNFFGISLGVMQIAGGLLVGQTAWQMISSQSAPENSTQQVTNQHRDIALIPMAIPLTSGPGAIGMVITLAAQNSQWWNYVGSLIGISLLGGTLYLCLALGEPLVRIIGKSGLKAFNQVLGFFILAISIQLIVNGTLAVF